MTRRGWALFALMGVLWGVPYLMIKVAVAEVSVPVLVFARSGIGALVLLPLALRDGQLATLARRWRPLAAFAALEVVVPWCLLSSAESRLTSSTAGLLIAATPIFAAVAVVVLRAPGAGERLTATRSIGLAIGFAGVSILAAPQLGGDGWAIGQVLLASACYATAPLIAARWLNDIPATSMTAACLALAAAVCLPPAAMTWPSTSPSGGALAAIVGLAVVCTALAYVGFLALIREVGPSRALVFTYVNPAVAVVAGVLVLAEPFTATTLVSFVLILGGSLLAAGPKIPESSLRAVGSEP